MVENLSALLFHRRYIHPSQHHGARTRQPTITYEPTCARCTKSQFLWLHERKERRKAKSLYYTICVNLASSINSSSLQGDFNSVVFYIIRTNDNVTTSGDVNLTPVTLVFSYTPCPAAWPYWHPAVVKITTDHPGPFSWCVTTGPQHAGGIITTGCRGLLTSGTDGESGGGGRYAPPAWLKHMLTTLHSPDAGNDPNRPPRQNDHSSVSGHAPAHAHKHWRHRLCNVLLCDNYRTVTMVDGRYVQCLWCDNGH